MTPRAYDRVAAAISLLLLLALAGGTYYLAELSLRAGQVASWRPAGDEPDYFVEGLVFTRINARGEPVFRIAADRMLHYPEDGTIRYSRPVMVSLDTAKPQITLSADTGESTSDGERTRLDGNVVLLREATPTEPTMRILTDHVQIFSETEIARTDRPVRVERGASVLTGVGMEFNNAARSLRVDSEVRLTWVPPQPAP